ncbi:cytochrome c, partial [candidate division TA06 bacterium]|nr:cytochrome c [candidate division TA06 bacterium]
MGKHPALAGPLFASCIFLLTSCQPSGQEWKEYQRVFREQEVQRLKALLETQPENDSLKTILVEVEERKIAVREVGTEGLGRGDRCATCHLGMDEDHHRSDPIPYRSHPPYYLKDHPTEKFGCTVCHRGVGEALTVREAHTEMLDIRFLEASCAQCHPGTGELRGAPLLSTGRELFAERGCTGCHVAGGFPEQKTGPSLVESPIKLKKVWLYHWLKNPRDYLPQSRMPNLHLSNEEAYLLTAYLLQRGEPEEVEEEVDWDAFERGKILIRESRCISCHAFGGRGGTLGPDLGKIGNKARREWLLDWIGDPLSHMHNTRMPQFRFTDEERESIVTYLLTEYTDPEFPSDIPSALELTDAVEEEGKALVRRFGCQGCHEMEGLEDGERRPGPDLTLIASKVSEERVGDWATASSTHPDYGFTYEEAQALTTLLLTFTGTVLKPSEPPYFPSGEAGRLFRELNCLACHKVRG